MAHAGADRARDASLLFWCAAFLLVAAGLFGGASQFNPVRLKLVEFCALPLLFAGIRGIATSAATTGSRFAFALIAGVIGLPLIHILPLPPGLWAHLPGGADRILALKLAGLSPGWAPLSLAPEETLGCLLALIPPTAMFLGVLQARTADLRGLILLWLLIGALCFVLGMAQIAGGPHSLFYLYRETNPDAPVGLFANKNHEAALFLALTPLAVSLALRRARAGDQTLRLLAVAFVFLALVGISVIRSRAGLAMAPLAVLGAALLIWRDGKGGRWASLGLATAAVLAVCAVLWVGLTPILDRFAPDPAQDARFQTWPTIAHAADVYQPFGAGFGTFARIYASVEPLTLVGPTYLNHAHNDYLEIWFEGGWPGVALGLTFVIWFAGVSLRAWRDTKGREASIARAGSLALVMLMAASTVDYPLRTEALATLTAFCCALLARAPQASHP